MDIYNLMATNAILFDGNFDEYTIKNSNFIHQSYIESKVYKEKLNEKIDDNTVKYCLLNPIDNYYLMLFILRFKKELLKENKEQFICELLKYGKVNQVKPYKDIVSSEIELSNMMKLEILEGVKLEENNLKTIIAIIKSNQFDDERKQLVLSLITDPNKIVDEETKKLIENLEQKRMN